MAETQHSVQRLQMVENLPSTKLHELVDQADHSKLVVLVVLVQPKAAAVVVQVPPDPAGTVVLESSPIFPALHSSMAAAAHLWALGHHPCMAQLLVAVEFLLLTTQM
jgi:hypothetical protein